MPKGKIANKISISMSPQEFSAFQEKHRLLISALTQLKTISELEDDWNENGAKHFEKSLLVQCFTILSTLEDFPPEVFPVADNSIQMEYDGDNDSYLQFRIYEDNIRMFRVLADGQKNTKYIDRTEVLKEVKDFYGCSQG